MGLFGASFNLFIRKELAIRKLRQRKINIVIDDSEEISNDSVFFRRFFDKLNLYLEKRKNLLKIKLREKQERDQKEIEKIVMKHRKIKRVKLEKEPLTDSLDKKIK